jgi:5'-nucleotidase
MHILLTNDDGIHAPGLGALHAALGRRHRVTVVAPDRERTAVGHGITLDRPLRAAAVSLNGGGPGFAVNGTPADCVKLALLEILEGRPDLVVAGLNAGANVGVNIAYSGTVAAAKEAAFARIPAIAASIDGREPYPFEAAAEFIAHLSEIVLARGLPPGSFLNVNFPNRRREEIAGVRVSRHGLAAFAEYVEKRVDPRNRVYYWQGADMQAFDEDLDVDGGALKLGFITVTPITCDATDYRMLEDLKRWALDAPSREG